NGETERPRTGGWQGAREVSGDWRPHAAVRRRRGGARGAGQTADQLGRAVTAIPLTAASVAAAAGGDVVAGDPGQAFDGVSIDTRTVQPGELFIAIRGERFDGADFVGTAIEAGAAGGGVGGEGGERVSPGHGAAAPARAGRG